MDSPPTCGLFTLPAEIRNQIYAFALTSSSVVHVITRRSKTYYNGERDITVYKSPWPPLLQVSQQTQSEAEGLYFDSNTFKINLRRTSIGGALNQNNTEVINGYLHLIKQFEIRYNKFSCEIDIRNGLSRAILTVQDSGLYNCNTSSPKVSEAATKYAEAVIKQPLSEAVETGGNCGGLGNTELESIRGVLQRYMS